MTMYNEEEWRRISEPPPLADLGYEDLLLVHRHWIWANQQRESFDQLLSERQWRTDAIKFPDKIGGSMVVWYGLLWAVIEALKDRRIELRDPLGTDVSELADILRNCRNAVLHVPRSGDYYDRRILSLFDHPDSARLIRTVHSACGRLLLQELQRRRS